MARSVTNTFIGGVFRRFLLRQDQGSSYLDGSAHHLLLDLICLAKSLLWIYSNVSFIILLLVHFEVLRRVREVVERCLRPFEHLLWFFWVDGWEVDSVFLLQWRLPGFPIPLDRWDLNHIHHLQLQRWKPWVPILGASLFHSELLQLASFQAKGGTL